MRKQTRKQPRLFEMAEEYKLEESEEIEDISQEDLRRRPHLEVYEKHFILTDIDSRVERVWTEGKQTRKAQARYQRVKDALENGFFDQKIEEAKSPDVASIIDSRLPEEQKKAIEEIFSAITSEVGRALVDILVLQLAIKALAPEQDIRLHKGNNSQGAFSWREGISLRTLDSSYIGPSLRRHGLLRMNKDGALMTRSFAENYPYTRFYKAEIRAKQLGKQQWLGVIDDLENGRIDAEAALLYVLQLLWKTSEAFNNLVQKTLRSLEVWLANRQHHSIDEASEFIKRHIERSEWRARLLEVAIHSLLQALNDLGIDLGGTLKPLMPMRTANRKHGNIGDVEVLAGDMPIEVWDAKYGQPYLRDTLDDLEGKIQRLNIAELQFGYVMLPSKGKYNEVDRKVEEIEEQYGLRVQILTFDEWIHEQLARSQAAGVSEENLVRAWLLAYAESLGQKRRDKAPIDEPTFDWVESLLDTLN